MNMLRHLINSSESDSESFTLKVVETCLRLNVIGTRTAGCALQQGYYRGMSINHLLFARPSGMAHGKDLNSKTKKRTQ